MQVNLVLLAGLGYSAVGALVMYFSHRSLCRKARNLVAGYPRDLAALRLQEHDGRYGLIILVCGNLLQVLAACGYSVSPLYWRFPSAIILGLMALYAVWRLLGRQAAVSAAHRRALAASTPRSAVAAYRVFETRRSAVLLDAAIREEANRKAREQARGPRDRSVVYVRHEWECRWWSDKFGVTQEALRTAVRRVGPMVADVERYFGLNARQRYPRAA